MPLVITTSIEAPGHTPVDDIKEFFEGLAEASRQHEIANGGGNVREASEFSCHGTVIGLVSTGAQLRRNGAQPDDLLVAIGDCGRFAPAFLRAKKFGFDSLSHNEKQQLCRPRAYIKEMKVLHDRGLLSAASDNSDGILGALWNIAEASGCTIELDMSQEILPERVTKTASEFGYNPWNFMFFWGDWQVVASVPPAQSDDFWRVAEEHHISVQRLGRACKGPPKLMGLSDGRRRRLKLIRNENFSQSSFNKNVTAHVEYMLRSQLWV
jgi:thiamine-monophosphate kinase